MAVSNARQIHLILENFEKKYGNFPDFSTVAAVEREFGSSWKIGKVSSNDFFRQTIAAGMAPHEYVFHVPIRGMKSPDGNMSGATALARGECAFTYLLGATMASRPDRPVAVIPMIPGTDRFDPKPFDHKVVMLRKDGTVTSININKAGQAVSGGGWLLMDPTNPLWEGRPPAIA